MFTSASGAGGWSHSAVVGLGCLCFVTWRCDRPRVLVARHSVLWSWRAVLVGAGAAVSACIALLNGGAKDARLASGHVAPRSLRPWYFRLTVCVPGACWRLCLSHGAAVCGLFCERQFEPSETCLFVRAEFVNSTRPPRRTLVFQTTCFGGLPALLVPAVSHRAGSFRYVSLEVSARTELISTAQAFLVVDAVPRGGWQAGGR